MQNQLDVLVKRAMAHDEAAFWRIYEDKWKEVYYIALKILEDENEAADATQETFFSAYKNIGSLKEPKAFGGWLYRIVINTCNDLLPRIIANKRHSDVAVAEETLAEKRIEFLPMEHLDKHSDQEKLLEAIEALPVEQKTAILLHYYDQMSYADIATATGVSKLGVETRLRRARKALKTSLMQAKVGSSVASAMVAAPVITKTLLVDSHMAVSPQVGDAMRVGLRAALGAVGGAAAAGGAAAGSTGAAVAGAAAGSSSAASSAVGTGMSLGAKLAVMATATTVVVGGVGAGIAISNSGNTPPEPQPIVASAPSEDNLDELTQALEALPSPEKEVEKPKKVETPKAPAEKPVEKEEPPKSIDSIADMIGDSNASKLAGYRSGGSKSATRSFLSALGFRRRAEQSVDGVTYRLLTLEKQDKRITLIEKSGDGYGISYRFGSKNAALPETWELMFEY